MGLTNRNGNPAVLWLALAAAAVISGTHQPVFPIVLLGAAIYFTVPAVVRGVMTEHEGQQRVTRVVQMTAALVCGFAVSIPMAVYALPHLTGLPVLYAVGTVLLTGVLILTYLSLKNACRVER